MVLFVEHTCLFNEADGASQSPRVDYMAMSGRFFHLSR
jgi:hypothetical protein